MNNNIVAQIRRPTDDELKRTRALWAALKQKSLPDSTNLGDELHTYFAHALRTISIVGGLHPVTGQPIIADTFPLRVSEDGVARLHDSVKLCSAILALWNPSETKAAND